MTEKLCIFCKHFDWGRISYTYYSELTGGDINGGASCNKGCYYEVLPENEDELRALFLRAEICIDYTLPDGVKK